MSTTLWATVTDRLGDAVFESWDGHRTRTRVAAHPADAFLKAQGDFISVDMNHNGPAFGEAVYLERSTGGNLWVVAVVHVDVDFEPDDGEPLYWSGVVQGRCRTGSSIRTDCELRSLAITSNPAGICLSPLRSLPGDIRSFSDRVCWRQVPALIERAAKYCERHRRDDPLIINDVDDYGHPVPEPSVLAERAYERPIGVPIEIRPARIVSVGGRPVPVH